MLQHASVLVASNLNYAIDFQIATSTKLQLINPYSAIVTITKSDGSYVPVDLPVTVEDLNGITIGTYTIVNGQGHISSNGVETFTTGDKAYMAGTPVYEDRKRLERLLN